MVGGLTWYIGESVAVVPGPGVHNQSAQHHVGPVRLETSNMVLTVVRQVLLAPLLGQVVPGDGGGWPGPLLCLAQQDDHVQLGPDDGGDGSQVEVYLHACHVGVWCSGQGSVPYREELRRLLVMLRRMELETV